MSALKLAINSPETIALAFREGIPVTSQFGGDQVMFTLLDGRKWYTAPFVAQKIAEAGIGERQYFTITKRELKTGNRRLVSYEVLPAGAAPAAAAVPQNGHNGIHQVPAAPVALPDPVGEYFQTTPVRSSAPAPVAPAPVPVATIPPVPVAPIPTVESAAAGVIKLAGKMAVDAVLEVEAYAQSRGMVDFTFGAENLQKIMVTLFIEMNKKGVRA